MKGDGLARYYLGHEQEAYYFDGIWHQGRWVGGAAADLGLSGEVRREEFQHLLQGFSPDGQRALVQNAKSNDRDAAWDLTFSAPKSVSVLWSMSSQEVRREIEAAHREAVEKTLATIETTAGRSRRGKGGAIKEPAALVFATFFHGASRAQDPAVHTHAVLPNVGLRRDGTTAALWTKNIFQGKMASGAQYRDLLADGLVQRLHLTLEKEKVGFHIRGVPRDLCETFSQRRRTIQRVMVQRGLKGAVAAKMVTLLTRPKKEHLPEKEFFARCHEIGRQFGFDGEKARQLVEQARIEWVSAQPAKPQQQQSGHEPPSAKPRTEKRDQEAPATRSATPGDLLQPAASPGPQVQEKSPSPERDRDARRQPRDSSRPAAPRHASAEAGDRPARSLRGAPSDPGDAGKAHATTDPAIGRVAGADPQAKPGHIGRSQPNRKEASQQNRPNAPSRGTTEPRRWFQQPEAQDGIRTVSGIVASSTTSQPQAPGGSDWPSIRVSLRPESERNTFDKARGQGAPNKRHQSQFEWRPLFPKAPSWSPARFAKVPAIALPDPKPRWGKVHSEWNLRIAKLRIQNRRLFPDAPKFNPLHKLEVPAFRLTSFPGSSDRERPAKWWTMNWKHATRLGEFRVQARHPFRDAPGWNPLQGLEIPALRFTSKRSVWTPVKAQHMEMQAKVQRTH